MPEMQPIAVPESQWLDRLRKNHFVHLVKENETARIEFAYEPPNPGCICGRIGIVRKMGTILSGEVQILNQQTWYIDVNGRGIDGSQIMAPVEDNLPTEPAPISEPWQRYMERKLDQLHTRIEQLEARSPSCPHQPLQ